MKISVDHFLKIGSSHKICEDYIISGYDPIPYVILSDGCSSSKDTDVGARILAHSAKKVLHELIHTQGIDILDNLNNVSFDARIYSNALVSVQFLGISRQCLDATLIIMYIYENHVKIHIWGDGCVLNSIKHYGKWITKINYSNSMPFYLQYKYVDKNLKEYRKYAINKTVEKWFDNTHMSIIPIPVENTFDITFDLNTNSYYLIASDGLDSFIQNAEHYNIELVNQELTAFKNTNGAFIQRRMKRALSEFEKQGITHFDDISIGGFFIGE